MIQIAQWLCSKQLERKDLSYVKRCEKGMNEYVEGKEVKYDNDIN